MPVNLFSLLLTALFLSIWTFHVSHSDLLSSALSERPLPAILRKVPQPIFTLYPYSFLVFHQLSSPEKLLLYLCIYNLFLPTRIQQYSNFEFSFLPFFLFCFITSAQNKVWNIGDTTYIILKSMSEWTIIIYCYTIFLVIRLAS